MAGASQAGSGRADVEGRSARKRRAIIEAATTMFLRNGYAGTSMDEVAAKAAVSKQTVYKHFTDKQGLFTEIILSTIDEGAEPFFDEVGALEDTEDFDRDLTELGRRLITIVMQPRLLQLLRLVTAEAGRFPELGHAFYDRGPGRTVAVLASLFQRLAANGLLRVDDPLIAAGHFNWLVVSIPMNKVILSGDYEEFNSAELQRFADAGVRAFLDGYRWH